MSEIFYLALMYLLSVCRCWRFVLDPIIVEASLTFAWCTCYLHGVWRWLDLEESWSYFLSSWFVDMVLHGVFRQYSSWCMEMVSSWGVIGFLVKVWFMFSFDRLSLDLGMVYEFDLLMRGLNPWLVIWYGLDVVEDSWLRFYGGFHTCTFYIWRCM